MNSASTLSHSLLFSNLNVHPEVNICVVIPVKDEENYIVTTLNAFGSQIDEAGSKLDPKCFEILILANNCSDQSVKLIEEFCRKNPSLNIYLKEILLESDQSNIGYVRKLLMDTAYKRLMENGGGIIMTTDGDTEVAPDWIGQNKLEVENGIEAVGGRILMFENELEEMDELTRSIHFKDEKYQLLSAEAEAKIIKNPFNPAPTHHQHFNGSFAITTDCYERSGGVPEVKFLEDCALFERLENIDAKVRKSNKVHVRTSARFSGRTQVGLSYQLNVWRNRGNDTTDIYVESSASIINRLKLKKQLLDLWHDRMSSELNIEEAINRISNDFNLNENVTERFKSSQYFGEWYSSFILLQEEAWTKNYPPETIDEAILGLEKEIRNL